MVPDRVVLTTGRAAGIFGGLANRPIVVRFWWFLQFWKALEKVDEECHGFRALATTLNNGNSIFSPQKLSSNKEFLQSWPYLKSLKSVFRLFLFVWAEMSLVEHILAIFVVTFGRVQQQTAANWPKKWWQKRPRNVQLILGSFGKDNTTYKISTLTASLMSPCWIWSSFLPPKGGFNTGLITLFLFFQALVNVAPTQNVKRWITLPPANARRAPESSIRLMLRVFLPSWICQPLVASETVIAHSV